MNRIPFMLMPFIVSLKTICNVANTVIEGCIDFVSSTTDIVFSAFVSSKDETNINPNSKLPNLSKMQAGILNNLVNRHAIKRNIWIRAKIILSLSQGHKKSRIAKFLGIRRRVVYKWLKVWLNDEDRLKTLEKQGVKDKQLCILIISVLSDAPRSGGPAKHCADYGR